MIYSSTQLFLIYSGLFFGVLVFSLMIDSLFMRFARTLGMRDRDPMMTRWANPALVEIVAAFSVITHFDGFQKGVIDTRDLFFFLSVIGFSLFATGVILRAHRAN